jgi:hypothetical protein
MSPLCVCKHYFTKAYGEWRNNVPYILNFGVSWSWVVSFIFLSPALRLRKDPPLLIP